MGCDIHLGAEVREGPGGAWKRAEKMVRNPYYDPRYKDEDPEFQREPWYRGRSYVLFGILAGVRDDTFTAISPERGVPDDATPETVEVVEGWDIDGHTHSHLTLEEILEYDWGERATAWDGQERSAWQMVEGGEFPRLLVRMREAAVTNKVGNSDVRVVFWFDN